MGARGVVAVGVPLTSNSQVLSLPRLADLPIKSVACILRLLKDTGLYFGVGELLDWYWIMFCFGFEVFMRAICSLGSVLFVSRRQT